MNRPAWKAAVAALALAMAGCGPPVVHVQHQVGGALAIPPQARHVLIEPLEVRTGPNDGYGLLAAQLLAKEIRRQTPWEVTAAPAVTASQAPVDLRLTGTLLIDVQEEATTQPVDSFEPTGQAGQPQAQAVLARLIWVRQVVTVTDVKRGAALGTLQTQEQYDSRKDGRSYGRLGLGRPDDPSAVPPARQIVPELLARLADTTAGMIAPQTARVDIRLRETASPLGRQGLEAAGRDRLDDARTYFEAAMRDSPSDPAVAFDLAVLQEAAGEPEAAREHYLLTIKLLGRDDAAARAGADRCAALSQYMPP